MAFYELVERGFILTICCYIRDGMYGIWYVGFFVVITFSVDEERCTMMESEL